MTASEDANGHTIGFRPIKASDKWHLSVLRDGGCALFIEPVSPLKFRYVVKPLSEFEGKTAELVGPKINGNRHGLTSHALVIHGAIEVDAPWKSTGTLTDWLLEHPIYEGIVIHNVKNRQLFKCHRGHLQLDETKWGEPWKFE